MTLPVERVGADPVRPVYRVGGVVVRCGEVA
jgi:hypothetical protein